MREKRLSRLGRRLATLAVVSVIAISIQPDAEASFVRECAPSHINYSSQEIHFVESIIRSKCDILEVGSFHVEMSGSFERLSSSVPAESTSPSTFRYHCPDIEPICTLDMNVPHPRIEFGEYEAKVRVTATYGDGSYYFGVLSTTWLQCNGYYAVGQCPETWTVWLSPYADDIEVKTQVVE